MSNENDERIQVGFEAYKDFFMNYYGGCQFFTLLILSMSIFIVSRLAADYIVGSWSQSPD